MFGRSLYSHFTENDSESLKEKRLWWFKLEDLRFKETVGATNLDVPLKTSFLSWAILTAYLLKREKLIGTSCAGLITEKTISPKRLGD